jgi:hypothetical protein
MLIILVVAITGDRPQQGKIGAIGRKPHLHILAGIQIVGVRRKAERRGDRACQIDRTRDLRAVTVVKAQRIAVALVDTDLASRDPA